MFKRNSMYRIKNRNMGCYLTNSANGDIIIRQIANALNSPLYSALNGLKPGLIFTWGILRGGDLVLKEAMKNKRDFYYLDHAYFNGGHETARPAYRIVKNELQLTKVYKRSSDRFLELGIKLKPWRKSGDYILICPPSPSTTYFYDLQYDWLDKVTTILSQVTDRPLYIRYKPGVVGVDLSKGYARPINIKHDYPTDPLTLEQHFEKAYCVISFNSMAAVQAVCAGVPVITSSISSAAPVGRTDLTDIEDLIYPEREPWLYSLAYSQFYVDEILNCKAFGLLGIK